MSDGGVLWPDNRRFSFTIFDDPDSQSLADSRLIYQFLDDLGIHTTVGVWPGALLREPNSPGETCASAEYREHIQRLQRRGFEIGFHLAAPHDSLRAETEAALDQFRGWFGSWPSAMANHYNAEALYWGESRVSGAIRTAYRLVQRVNPKRHEAGLEGHVPGSPFFWGDICASRIRYCRNFVFRDINTLKACPAMPYHDPRRPYVPLWYASSEGNRREVFLETISEASQDRLEEEGGCCVMYVHFGHGFVERGRLHPRFVELMKRLSRKPGWFAPVTPVLDHLRARRPDATLTDGERFRLELSWFLQKLRYRTS